MPTIVQTFQGRVTGLWGSASLRGADGKMRALKVGDVVNRGDVILTSQDGIVQLSPDETAAAQLAAAAAATPAASAAATSATPEIDRIITGLDNPDSADATAVGVAGGDGAGDLSPGLRVDRIVESLTPASLALPGNDADTRADLRGGAATAAEDEAPPTPLGASSASISATEEGPAVALGLAAPTGTSTAAVITVTQLPLIGVLQKADGTPVALGSVLTAAELTGLTYLPPADYDGSAPAGQFTYSVTDQGTTTNGGVTIALGAVNDAPVGNADTAGTPEDTAVAGNVLANDSDVDGNTLSVTQYTIAGVAHAAGTSTTLLGIGTLVLNANGAYTFTPAADYSGAVPPITYTLSDGTVTRTSTLTLAVTPVNDPPTAANDIASTPINAPVTVAVLANDTDRDGNPISVTGASLANPAQGTVVVNADGSVTFTPANNVVGPVVVNYTIGDGQGGSASASITVNVGNNSAPAGADAARTTAEDTPYTVTTGDFGFTDADAGQSLANVRIDTLPTAGTLLLNGAAVLAGAVVSAADIAAGRLVFAPAPDANGAPYTIFTFSVQDSAGTFDTTPNTLTLNVTPVNDAPVALADTANATEDTPVTGNVLANDTDVDGTPLQVNQFVIAGTTYPAGSTATLAGIGTLVIQADGGYTFTPAANYNGPVPVATYTATDGTLTSTATLTISLAPVNDAPVAADDLASTPINTPIVIGVLGNDSDADGNALTVTAAALANPAQGTVTFNPNGTLNFTPANNVTGTVVITYAVSDGQGGTDTATVTVNVGNNTPPTGADSARTIAEDTSYTVQAGDFGFADADAGQTLANVRIDTLPAAGALLLSGIAVAAGAVISAADIAAGKLVFVPAADANGAPYANLTFSVQDSAGAFDAAPNALTFNVTPVNDVPVAVVDTVNAIEDQPFIGTVAANDTLSPDGGNVFALVAGNGPANGGIVFNANGTFTYTPGANYNGADSFTYSLTDANGDVSTATVTVNVASVNDVPVAVADSVAAVEDTPFVGSVAGNDTLSGDSGNVFSLAAGSGPTNGGIVFNANGTFTYTPGANYNGADSFTYSLTDANGDVSTATVTVNVASVNDVPVAVADSVAAVEDTPFVGSVAGNDTLSGDIGNVFSLVAGSGPTNGGIVFNNNGTFTYTPSANYSGGDTFSYSLTDANGDVSTATVSINVASVNDVPVAVADTVAAVEDTPFVGSVSTNDTPSGDGGNVFSLVSGSGPTNGGIVFNANGTFTYTPSANYNGADSFTYSLTDANGDVSTATVAINVASVNDVPVAVADAVAAVEDTPFVGSVGSNDTLSGDGGNVFSLVAGSGPTNGGIVFNANGTFTYTPSANYNGADAFSYSLTDANGDVSTATVSINVASVNDVPVAVADSVAAVEDTPFVGSVAGNDTLSGDGGNVFSLVAGSGPTNGGIVFNANGTFTYTPSANYSGPDSFTYSLTDATGDVSTATVAINVASVNDVPVAVADSVNAVEDTPFVGSVAGNDTLSGDGGNVFALVAGSGPANGGIVFNADGTFTYTPSANYNGADSFSYALTDANGDVSTATVSVNVASVNDVPVAVADSVAAVEDTPFVGSVGGNDTLSGDGGNVFSLVAGSGPANGGIVFNANGTFTYTPSANYNGTDTFSYSLTDANGDVSTATVAINVAAINDAPLPAPNANSTPEDTPLIANAANGLLANDSDIDSASFSVTQFSVAGTAGSFAAGSSVAIAGVGSLTINGDGAYSFTPFADYNGPVPVATYTVSDGTLTSTSTLALNVTPVNDAPVLSLDADQSHNTVSVQAIAGLFNTGASNAGGTVALGTLDPHYTLVSAPAGSTLTASATSLSYAWIPNDADSTWIGNTGNQPTGIYQYQTSFSLQPGADPASVNIAFDLASDNTLRDILVNGVSTGFSSNLQYGAYTHVELHGASAAFGSGLNTITFVIDNRDPGSPTASGPTGLRIDNMSGNVAVITPDSINHLSDYATIYVEGTPVSIADADADVIDVDSPTLQSATITLTNAQLGDLLQVGTLPAGIVASVDPTGTVVTLAGAASQASYEAAIRAVQFNNSSENPSGAVDRLVTVVVNDGVATSNAVTTTVHVVPVDDTPTLDLDANDSTATGTGYSGSFFQNSAGVAIVDADIAIDDIDSGALRSASIRIANVQPGDVLTAGALPAGILAAIYDPASGVLTLSGAASLADYQAALAGIRFSNADANLSTVDRSIEISVNDGSSRSNLAVSVIQVAQVNDAPAGTDNTVTTLEDTAHVLARADFGFGDTLDTPADQFAAVSVGPVSTGTLALNGVAITATTLVSVAQLDAGQLTFTPAPNATGNTAATLQFQVRDDGGTANGGVDTDASPNTLSVNVTPVNDAPVAVADTAAATEGVTLTRDAANGVLVNDTDVDAGDSKTVSAVSFGATAGTVGAALTGTYGTLTLNADGSYTYLANRPAAEALAAGQTASETFSYTVRDAAGATSTASLELSVTGSNDAPVAVADTATASEAGGAANGTAGVNPSGNVLANDTDADSNDAKTVSAVSGTAAGAVGSPTAGSYGSLVLNADGSYTYNVNNSATAVQALRTASQSLTDTFTYTVRDAAGATSSTTLTVTITGSNDAPVAIVDTGAATENVTLSKTAATGVLANDTDVDSGDSKTVSAVSFGATAGTVGNALTGTYGTLTLNADGSYTYLANRPAAEALAAGQTATETFSYTVRDAAGATSTASLELTVTGSNDAPVNQMPGAQTVAEDASLVFSTANGNAITVADADSASLTVTLSSANGSLTLGSSAGVTVSGNGTGTLTLAGGAAAINAALNGTAFKHTADYNGSAQISVSTTDGTAPAVQSTIGVTVTPVVDIAADTASTFEGSPVTINVNANDSFENAGHAVTAINGTAIAAGGSVAVANGSVLLQADGQLVFTPTAGYNTGNGAPTGFSYTVTSGGRTETASVDVSVVPVNNAPTPTLAVTPVGRWTFDENTGTTTVDKYNARTGTLSDSTPSPTVLPTFTTGHTGTSGSALRFDGAGSQVALNAATTAPLMGTSSLSFWIKTTQTGSGNSSSWDSPAVIGSENAGGGNDLQWGAINASGKIGFGLGNVAGVFSTTSVNDNAWHQVAITRDAVTKLVSVYVDGVFEASGSPNDAAFTAALNRLTGFGANNNFSNDAAGSDLVDNRFLRADLDDVRIYDHVLTAGQVAAIKSVEAGYHDLAVANDGDATKITLTAGNYTALTVGGLNAGMVITDGTAGHTATATGPDSTIDLTGWNLNSISVSGTGTGSALLAFNATDTVNGETHTATQYLNIVNGTSLVAGGTGNDTLNGTANADLLVGNAGNDALNSADGNDRLLGGAGNDTLDGGAGNDIVYGGSGNDILIGGNGADTFAWKLADRGAGGAPATDTVNDFDLAASSAGGDSLDLRDLLVGANHVGSNPGNLQSYLDFDTTSAPGSTIVHISSSGGFAGGTYSAAAEDQRIVLQGVDVRSPGAFGLAPSSSDNDVIAQLLQRGKLVTDGP